MKIVYLSLLSLITFSCYRSDDPIFKIDPRKFIENKITLSDIADDIKYVPLDNSIPFINFAYLLTPDFLYVSAKGIGILKFDRDGKLIKTIGKRGRGPEEFLYGMAFTVDCLSGNVFVLDPGSVKVYSPSGIYLRNISLKDFSSGFGFSNIEIFHSLLFFPDYIPKGDSKYCWFFLDTLGHLISKKENSVPKFQTNIETEGCFYKFENKLFYFNYFNDTVFSISPDLRSAGVYLFTQGNHRWPKNIIETRLESQFNSQLYNLFRPARMFETRNYIVLEYAYQDRWAISLIDKKTKKTFLAFKNIDSPIGIVNTKACISNDLDGGIPLSNIKYYSDNTGEYITTLITPFDLKTYISSDDFIKAIVKYPEKKKELQILSNGINEADNPILMIIRLKK